jgi:hypothetical protein
MNFESFSTGVLHALLLLSLFVAVYHSFVYIFKLIIFIGKAVAKESYNSDLSLIIFFASLGWSVSVFITFILVTGE